MYCGVPAFVSNTTSLPEITAGAALLVDPVRPKHIASAMHAVLQDKRLYNDMLVRGRKLTEGFSWQKTAQEVLRILSAPPKEL
jgi:glycosyltransferase involved in cell wall biosynthesis